MALRHHRESPVTSPRHETKKFAFVEPAGIGRGATFSDRPATPLRSHMELSSYGILRQGS